MFVPREISPEIVLRVVQPEDAPAMAHALSENREYLAPWEPLRPPEYFTAGWWIEEIRRARKAMNEDNALPLVLSRGSDVVGRFTLGSIARGPFQSAGLGYWVVESHAGRGLATHTVRAIADDARDRLRLHRIEASTLVNNAGSQRVLTKAGFEGIGLAPRYLSIAGEWQDHLLFQRILQET